MRLPKVTRTAGALMSVALVSCGSGSTKRQTLVELACGATKLRIDAVTRSSFDTRRNGLALLVEGAKGWVQVDRTDGGFWGLGPETFSRVLAPALAFHAIPFDQRRPRAKGRPHWPVFVDPAGTTRAEYDAIGSCLSTNAVVIDKALGADTPEERDNPTDSRPQITGTVYSRIEQGFMTCEGPTLGAHWECADGKTFLKTVMNDQQGQVMLCPVTTLHASESGSGAHRGPDGMVAARLSDDQAALQLLEGTANQYSVSPGPDPKAYYATCRDAEGKTIFDAFPQSPAKTAPLAPNRKPRVL